VVIFNRINCVFIYYMFTIFSLPEHTMLWFRLIVIGLPVLYVVCQLLHLNIFYETVQSYEVQVSDPGPSGSPCC